MYYVDPYSSQTAKEIILQRKSASPNPAVAVILMDNPTPFGIPDTDYQLPLATIHDKTIKHAHAKAVNMGYSKQTKREHHYGIVEREWCANYNPARDEILENRISNDLKKLLDMEYHTLLKNNKDAGFNIATLTKPLRKDNSKNYWNTLPFPARVEILEVVTFFNDLKNKSVNELAALYSKQDLDFYLGRELVTTKLKDSTFTKAEQEKLEELKLIVNKIAVSDVAYYLQNLLFKDFNALVKKNKPAAKKIAELTKGLRQEVPTTTYWNKLSLEFRIDILKVVAFLSDLSRDSILSLARKYLGVDKKLGYFTDHKLLKSKGLTSAEQAKLSQVEQFKKNKQEKEPFKEVIAKRRVTEVKSDGTNPVSTPCKLYLPDNDLFNRNNELPKKITTEKSLSFTSRLHAPNNLRIFNALNALTDFIQDGTTLPTSISLFASKKKLHRLTDSLKCCFRIRLKLEAKYYRNLQELGKLKRGRLAQLGKGSIYWEARELVEQLQKILTSISRSSNKDTLDFEIIQLNKLVKKSRFELERIYPTQVQRNQTDDYTCSHAQISSRLTAPADFSLKDILLSSFTQLPEYLKSSLFNKGPYSSLDDLETNWNDVDYSNRVQLLYRLPSDNKGWVNLLQPEAYKTAGLASLNISKENWLNSSISDEKKKRLLKLAANSIKQQAWDSSLPLRKPKRFLSSLNSFKKRNFKHPLKRQKDDTPAPIFHIRAPKIEKSSATQQLQKPQFSPHSVELTAVDNPKLSH